MLLFDIKGGNRMKVSMKRQLKAFVLAMFCIVLIVPALNVSAVTQRQKAMAAYKKYLSQSKVYVMPKGTTYQDLGKKKDFTYNGTPSAQAKFCIANIDNDSIPELVISAKFDNRNFISVLTYKNGKVCRISYHKATEFLGYYPKTGVYFAKGIIAHMYKPEGVGYSENYIKISGSSEKSIMSKDVQPENKKPVEYSIGSKTVSAKEFAAYRTKVTGGKSLLKVKLHNNTATNRNRKIK